MRKLSLALTAVYFSLTLASCAQGKKTSYTLYAYKAEHLPGMMARDENGNPVKARPDTVLLLYVDAADSIRWTEAWMNGSHFTVQYWPIHEKEVELGRNNLGKPVILRPGKGSRLWQLEITAAGNKQPPYS